MSKLRVVISGATFPAEVTRNLEARGLSIQTVPGNLDSGGIVKALDGAWGYVLGGSERMTKEVWRDLPELRVVCFLGTGYRTFLEPPTDPGATQFTYTPYANASAVAEFTLALALDLIRRVTERANEVRAGAWSEESTPSLVAGRIGVAGMGHVGQEVARMASSAFGSEVLYWNRSHVPGLEACGYRRVNSIVDLCAEVDVLSINMGYAPGENDGAISTTELTALGPCGLLVNTARAELVDPSALREALLDRRIAAAAFDGYYEEPTPAAQDDRYGLLGLAPRMLVTPHCAYLSRQAMRRMADMAAANLLGVAEGSTPPHLIPR